jgi:hypothetical protein
MFVLHEYKIPNLPQLRLNPDVNLYPSSVFRDGSSLRGRTSSTIKLTQDLLLHLIVNLSVGTLAPNQFKFRGRGRCGKFKLNKSILFGSGGTGPPIPQRVIWPKVLVEYTSLCLASLSKYEHASLPSHGPHYPQP